MYNVILLSLNVINSMKIVIIFAATAAAAEALALELNIQDTG